jgi:hypothetical protein
MSERRASVPDDELRPGLRDLAGPLLTRPEAQLLETKAVVDVLPAYVLFCTLQYERHVPPEALRALVDDVLLPSLTRLPLPSASADAP